jgi:putative FmdB family regulatory protein
VPTYEYECTSCRRTFEIRQRISEPPLSTCETCGGAVRRLLSPAPFILKGGGWYVTDYPSESRKKAMDAEKSSASTGSGDKGEKTDKAEKSDKTPAAVKTDGTAAGSGTTAASSPASASKSSD